MRLPNVAVKHDQNGHILPAQAQCHADLPAMLDRWIEAITEMCRLLEGNGRDLHQPFKAVTDHLRPLAKGTGRQLIKLELLTDTHHVFRLTRTVNHSEAKVFCRATASL
jgi:hypothetical protein